MRFGKYLQQTDGNVAITTAIAAVVLTGAAGAATIYGQALTAKTSIQSSLDGAVLAATELHTGSTDEKRIEVAKAAFATNLQAAEKSGHVEFEIIGMPEFLVKNLQVKGTARAKIVNTLAAAIGITKMDVDVSAQAAKRTSTPLCVLTLNNKNDQSLHVYGDAKFDADCPVQINSTSGNAGEISGSKSSATANPFGVTGKVAGRGWSPPPITGTEPVIDPYASLPVPDPGACTMNNAVIMTDTTLNPGTYCGGLTVKTGTTVTLNPGIYVMLDGQFRTDSGGNIVGDEVLIALEGADSYLYLGSDSAVKLTSPKTGLYKNMQFMSDRDLSQSKHNEEWTQISSGAILEYDGVMYLPEQNFWVSGTGHQVVIKGYSPSMCLVVDTIWAQGNAVLQMRMEDRRGIGDVAQAQGFAYGAILTR